MEVFHPVNVPSLTFCDVPFQSKDLVIHLDKNQPWAKVISIALQFFLTWQWRCSPFSLLFARKKWGDFPWRKPEAKQRIEPKVLAALVWGPWSVGWSWWSPRFLWGRGQENGMPLCFYLFQFLFCFAVSTGF